MIILALLACLETVPQAVSPQLSLCDRLSLRFLQCGSEVLGESQLSRCAYFPLQRIELSPCMEKSCEELSDCVAEVEKKGWTPQSDPDFCEAFRQKKVTINALFEARLKQEPERSDNYRKIYWVAGAECETDNSLAEKCYDKQGEEMLNCILDSSDLLPNLSLSPELK